MASLGRAAGGPRAGSQAPRSGRVRGVLMSALAGCQWVWAMGEVYGVRWCGVVGLWRRVMQGVVQRCRVWLVPFGTDCNSRIQILSPSPPNRLLNQKQVLKERGVQEHKIMFLTLVAAPEGIHKICGRFPGIKLVASEVDAAVNDNFETVPGVGSFADRYFCE